MTVDFGWQIDADAWASVPKDLSSSRNWRFVGFAEMEADAVPGDKSGVYMFCTSPVGVRPTFDRMSTSLFSLLLTPIYIGRTNNLRRRFVEHCRRPSPEVRAARACFGASMRFWFHPREYGATRNDEATLIGCFGPAANRRKETVRGRVGKPRTIGVRVDDGTVRGEPT